MNEKLFDYFKTVTPEQFLTDTLGGIKPLKREIELIKEVRNVGHFDDGVINVLFSFIMLTTDGKLMRSTILKTATYWARCKVQTVEQAVAISRETHANRNRRK